jgi:beta-glucosidase
MAELPKTSCSIGCISDVIDPIDELIPLLTLSEKVSLLSGTNMWETASVPRLSIQSLRTTDGPAGARGTQWSGGSKAAVIPCGTSLAAIFDPSVIERIGRLLAEETKAKDAHILLGPNVDINRSPLGGRNFESYGEDPFLSGVMGSAIVRGIQGYGGGD